jgi:peptidoglycan hydrolase-like protein with peptidoglycan-binding domain
MYMRKYIIAVALLLTLVAPATISAQTADIDPSTTSSGCITLTQDLRYRTRDIGTNGDVSALQDFLSAKGFLNSEPTGYFGLLTFAAVKNYQSASGISPTGFVGPLTRASIKAKSCGGGIIVEPPFNAGCPAGALYNYLTGALCNSSPTASIAVFPDKTSINSGATATFTAKNYTSIPATKWTLKLYCPPGLTASAQLKGGLGCNETLSLYNQPYADASFVAPIAFTNTTNTKLQATYSVAAFANADQNIPTSGTLIGSASTNVTVIPTGDTSTSRISVIFPNGGEAFLLGGKDVDFRINWTYTNLTGNVTAYLRYADGATCKIGGAPVSAGSMPVSLGFNYQCSNIPRTVTAGQYTILLAADNGNPLVDPAAKDSSDYPFTITTITSNVTSKLGDINGDGQVSISDYIDLSSMINKRAGDVGYNPKADLDNNGVIDTRDFAIMEGLFKAASIQIPPSIQVTYPNGGETFTRVDGKVIIPVRWVTSGIPSSATLDLVRLRGVDNGVEYNLAYNVTNDGFEYLSVPTSVPDNTGYTLEIKTAYNGTIIMDKSDSYFKINSYNATQPFTINVVPTFTGTNGQNKKYTLLLRGGTTANPIDSWVLNFSCPTNAPHVYALVSGEVCDGAPYQVGNEINGTGNVDLQIEVVKTDTSTANVNIHIKALRKDGSTMGETNYVLQVNQG